MPNDFTTDDIIEVHKMSGETGQPFAHLLLFFGFSHSAATSRISHARKRGYDIPYLPRRGGGRGR